MKDASYDRAPVAAGERVSKPIRLRTCVGCRRRCPDVELLRIVVADGALVPDPRRRLPGRGAWIHPSDGCFATAHKRRAVDRALRAGTGLDAEPLERYLAGEASR